RTEERRAHLFKDHVELDRPITLAAVLFGDAEALQGELVRHQFPDVGIVALFGRHQTTYLGLGLLLFQEALDHLAELFLLLAAAKVHRDPSIPYRRVVPVPLRE